MVVEVSNMNDRLSNKFRWLSMIATWAVVCIHARTGRWVVDANDIAESIEQNINDIFCFAI